MAEILQVTSVKEDDVLEVKVKTSSISYKPVVIFIKYCNKDGSIVLVGHRGGMLELKDDVFTAVPNLTWKDVLNYVDNDQLIQDVMLHVTPGWRDFIMSGINSDEFDSRES
jgi:hypothetical protein